MNSVFYVKDYVTPDITDSEAIELCFADANAVEGEKTVVFDGRDYHVDRAILVDSDTTVVVDNCTIKQNDFVFDNSLSINDIDYLCHLGVKKLQESICHCNIDPFAAQLFKSLLEAGITGTKFFFEIF